MAKLSKIEARKALAMEAHTNGLVAISRKLDWIILHVDPSADPAMIGAGIVQESEPEELTDVTNEAEKTDGTSPKDLSLTAEVVSSNSDEAGKLSAGTEKKPKK